MSNLAPSNSWATLCHWQWPNNLLLLDTRPVDQLDPQPKPSYDYERGALAEIDLPKGGTVATAAEALAQDQNCKGLWWGVGARQLTDTHGNMGLQYP